MDVYLSSASFCAPEYFARSAWIDHAPFAFWLMKIHRPRCFVELGTQEGYSYFAFCQAVKSLGLDTRCFAVDHWKGDEHAGFYGEDVFKRVQDYNERYYASFSRLVRLNFNEAFAYFPDDSIDLLHIDGRHFYEDVTQDFEHFRPKMSERAVVLFHDTNVRERNFGVYKLWAELAANFPSFEFFHGHGLGVLGCGAALPKELAAFFAITKDAAVGAEVRQVYARLGGSLKFEFEARETQAELTAKLTMQEARAGALQAERGEHEVKLSARTKELERAQSEAEGLKVKLEAYELKLSTRTKELERAQSEAEGLKVKLEAYELKLSTRTKELECAQSETKGLTAKLEVHEAKLGTEAQKLKQREEEAKSLRRKLAWREAQLVGIYSSTSWRITAPLRAVSLGLRSLLRNSLFGNRQPSMRKVVPEAEAEFRRPPSNDKIDYSEWIARNDTLSADDRLLICSHLACFHQRPTFSILMPVYNPSADHLRQAIESVLVQLYQDWELCIVDSSNSNSIRIVLEEYVQKDIRVRLGYHEANGGSSACINSALDMASGDWIVLMNDAAVLSEHALYLIAEAIDHDPDLSIIYSDEDHINDQGLRCKPYFKPDWDYDLFLGQNLIGHLGAYRTDVARQTGGFREGFDGAQGWDFALRILEAAPNPKVYHVPFILCHQRHTDAEGPKTSVAHAADAAQRAVNEHFSRTKQAAVAIPKERAGHLRIRRELPAERPLVSIIIPTRDQGALLRTCVDGILNRTDYKPIEIVIVDNGSRESDAVALLADICTRENVKLVEDSEPFNFSRLINRGVAASSGDVCILLNNDVDIINSDWLDEMVSHALRPEVGAVGAKLYYANDTLQHGGVILGGYNAAGSVAGHVHHRCPRKSPGHFNRLDLTHNLSCVTAACLAVRRNVYDALGGFNERNLAVSFNDVDFCIRIRRAGYKIIWTPNAELYHYERSSRGDPEGTPEKAAQNSAERAYMRQQWSPVLDSDPFYNPNLSLHSVSFEPSATPRVRKPWWELQFASTCGVKQEVANALLAIAQKRLNISVTRRITHIEAYKNEVANYIAARDKRVSQPKDDGKIVVYTAISAGYDSIKLPEKLDPRFDYVLFTDAPTPKTGVWQVRPITYLDDDKTRRTRFVKTHPHLLLQGYDIAIWIDANIMIVGDLYPMVEDFLQASKPLAAIPHPFRNFVSEEADACLSLKLDEADTIQAQSARYRAIGLDCGDVIESNFMMFDMTNERIKLFLNAWWREIDRFSKRDQLSVNYALQQAGIDCHWLTEHPNSVRNDSRFTLVRHDSGNGSAQALIDALQIPLVDPYAGRSYAEVRDQRIAAHRERKIDIVVCVHNALAEVKECLASICRARKSEQQRLIIVDDGSDRPTAEYLREFAAKTPWVELHRNENARGYTKAANQGLAASTGELVILLNSDTVVTDAWAEKMADALFATPGAGIVGPISNAASHQSIPEHRNSGNQTAINALPPGMTAEDMNRQCEQWTMADLLPRVPLVHGFCFGVAREVIRKVGLFDHGNFPFGYGEENDYCFRAADAGFSLVIATHTYVFHSKSKSYGDSERVALMKAGSESLRRLHGRARTLRAIRSMEAHPILVGLRRQARSLTESVSDPARPLHGSIVHAK